MINTKENHLKLTQYMIRAKCGYIQIKPVFTVINILKSDYYSLSIKFITCSLNIDIFWK